MKVTLLRRTEEAAESSQVESSGQYMTKCRSSETSVLTLALTMYKPDESPVWEPPMPVVLSNEQALKARLRTGDTEDESHSPILVDDID